jgi:3-oxocholest-4-en-26-oyl-CoA dehydrogenase alpha subunit
MNFELSPEQEKFRKEVSGFLDKEVTDKVKEESESGGGYGPHSWDLMRKLGAKRWLAPSFPVEYGGLGLSHIYRYIVLEELDYRNALIVIHGVGSFGIDMAGPIILRHGNGEQKKQFLSRIASGEIEFALGYTEPDAGSDLSRISIRAVEDGDDFVITGQKTFNTACHYAQYHWLAARTDPDAPINKGMSMFVVDLKTPGITINPLWEITDIRTNEVFYDEVRVPKKNMVGEKNHGWYYMVSALDLERVITIGNLELMFQKLVAYSKNTMKDGVPLAKDPLVRQKLADMAIEINVGRNLIRRVVWLQDKGSIPNYEASMLKLFITELHQRMAQIGLEILGFYGQLRKGSKHSIFEGMMERRFRGSYFMTIGGGTSEVMRNIIALRGLKLPR